MKRKSIYALPFAALFAAAAAGQAMAAGDKASGKSAADSGYGTQSESGSGMQRSQGSSAGQSMSDAAITAKVKSALLAEPDFPSTQVSVETNDGVVQLSGFVTSQTEIDRAVSIAQNIQDVKAVENKLQADAGGSSGGGMQQSSPMQGEPQPQEQSR